MAPDAPLDLSHADDTYARAVEHLPGGNSRTTIFVPPRPPYAERGAGAFLYDIDGHEILDLQNNYTSLIHGHARREIVEEAVAAIRDGTSFSLPTVHEVALAERLTERIPAAERWRFANSGTEAVMMAIRLARAATGRAGVLRFQGAYHGSYDAGLQPPTRGVPPSVEAEIVTVPVGDGDALVAALEEHGHRLACVLFDAMPNRAGLVPAERDFVDLLRRETERHEVLLVQDEVITFRMAYGGIQSWYDLRPDLVTVGKIMGGGFPVGAIGGRADLMDLFDPRRPDPVVHPGTFSANPVSLRAGRVSLDLLTAAEIERINDLGDRLRTALSERGWPVSGRGSLLQVRVPDPKQLWWGLYEAGVMIAANGLACLSTAVDDSHVERALVAFDRLGAG
jgi:glutamate-1-semialdehyde 2,1-aminomutase